MPHSSLPTLTVPLSSLLLASEPQPLPAAGDPVTILAEATVLKRRGDRVTLVIETANGEPLLTEEEPVEAPDEEAVRALASQADDSAEA